jgi:photosystem II stability/assembly factor-like uncharacterized protein
VALFVAAMSPAVAHAGINEWTALSSPSVWCDLIEVSPRFATDGVMLFGGVGRKNVDGTYSYDGVLRSADGGRTSSRVGYAQGLRAVTALAMEPGFSAATGIVLAGTDKGAVLRSIDGGRTWAGVATGLPAVRRIRDVCFSPSFATDRTVFLSYEQSLTSNALPRYFAVSYDAGLTWIPANLSTGDGTYHDGPQRVAVSGSSAVAVGGRDGVGVPRGISWTPDGLRWHNRTAEHAEFVDVDMVSASQAFAVTADGRCYASTDGGATWTSRGVARPSSGDAYTSMAAIDMADPTHGFICGENGYVFVTSDGGTSWLESKVLVDTWFWSHDLSDITAVSVREAWCVVGDGSSGDQPVLFHTRDGGVTWNQVTPAFPGVSGFRLKSVDFIDARRGVACGTIWDDGFEGILVTTDDGGTTWKLVRPGVEMIDRVACSTARWYAAGQGRKVTTTSYDETPFVIASTGHDQPWSQVMSPGSRVTDIAFDGGFGVMVTGRESLQTRDGGVTWTPANQGPVTGGGIDVSPDFSVDRTVVMAGDDSATFAVSRDGGHNWDVRSAPGGASLLHMAASPSFASDRTLFAVSKTAVYRSVDEGESWQRIISAPWSLGQYASKPVFSPRWAQDGTMFVVMQGYLWRSRDRGASFEILGSRTLELARDLALHPDFPGPPTVYSAFRKYEFSLYDNHRMRPGSFTFGARRKARLSKPVVIATADGTGRLLLFRGRLAPGHPIVHTNRNQFVAETYVHLRLYRYSSGAYRLHTTRRIGVVRDEHETRIYWNRLPAGRYYAQFYHSCPGETGHLGSVSARTYFTKGGWTGYWTRR